MRILVTGDFVPRNRVKNMTESGDYSYFDEVKSITSQVDYSIINFESPIVEGEAKPIDKTGPNLRCHSNAMKAVKYAGFNCVTLANNHFYDFGENGVLDTLKACNENNIDYVGGGINIEEAEKILYKEINGEILAVINICEHEWSIATKTAGGSAPLNLITNVHKIAEAKKNADYVLVIVHGGTEHYQLPTPRMKATYRFFIEAGADVVINHHQHCYSGYEEFNGKIIYYGLGNFCFDKNRPNDSLWNEGYAVEINLNKNSITYTILPYIQCAENPKVTFIKETTDFEYEINKLNKIILNDNILFDEFINMSKRKSFLIYLEPYNTKWLRKLKSKGLLPSFINRYKKNVILNLFRCEAHRDVMFELLKNKISSHENSYF